jgi:predicted component of type VI protein secretion system
MSQEKLRSDLEALHAELKQTKSVEGDERQLLQTLAEDIQKLLTRTEEPSEQYQGLGNQLRDAIAKLEARHPSVTLAMRQVIDSLSFLGI